MTRHQRQIPDQRLSRDQRVIRTGRLAAARQRRTFLRPGLFRHRACKIRTSVQESSRFFVKKRRKKLLTIWATAVA
jgi:hypothetical protein